MASNRERNAGFISIVFYGEAAHTTFIDEAGVDYTVECADLYDPPRVGPVTQLYASRAKGDVPPLLIAQTILNAYERDLIDTTDGLSTVAIRKRLRQAIAVEKLKLFC